MMKSSVAAESLNDECSNRRVHRWTVQGDLHRRILPQTSTVIEIGTTQDRLNRLENKYRVGY